MRWLLALACVLTIACDTAIPSVTLPTVPTLPGLKSPLVSFRVEGLAPLVGTTSQFAAIATFASGLSVNVSSEVAWTSSSQVVAGVDTNGLVTGRALGVVELTGTFQGFSDKKRLMVTGPGTYFMFISDPGDPVGTGLARSETDKGWFFGGMQGAGHLLIHFDRFEGNPREFLVRVLAPNGQPLTVGTYDNAVGWHGPLPVPSLRFENESKQCPDLLVTTGRFTVHELVIGPSGLPRVHVSFEQMCFGGFIGTRGDVAVR